MLGITPPLHLDMRINRTELSHWNVNFSIFLHLQRFYIEKQFEICGISLRISYVRTLSLNCYRSCVNTDLKVFFDQFSSLMESHLEQTLKFIICGDFDIDPIRDKN